MTTSLIKRLRVDATRFGFDAVVRVLQHRAGVADPAVAMRFRTRPGAAFPASEVGSVDTDLQPPAVEVKVLGLIGAVGVLPRLYGETANAMLRSGSGALHAFIDLLGHGMIAAFARAGIKYRLHRAVETAALAAREEAAGEPGQAAGRDPIAAVLLALSGHATPHLLERVAVGGEPLLHYAGLLAMRPRSAERLEALASDWLGRPVQVRQFVGTWLTLPPDQWTRLPRGHGAGAFARLGEAAIGVRAYDVQARIVLAVGPLDRAAFTALLPDGPGLGRLVSLVRTYLGLEVDFAVNLVVAAEAVPPLQLPATGDVAAGARLGWNSWLALPAERPRRHAAGEPVFSADVAELHAARSREIAA